MKKTSNILSVFVAFAAVAASALPVPESSTDGISLRIENLDPLPPKNSSKNDKANLGAPEADAEKPLPLLFTIENRSGKTVSGKFKAWMNDDWTLDVAGSENMTLAPGEKKSVSRLAAPGPRVLPALYPVHAEFVYGPTNTSLHPVAVFRAKTSNRAFRLPKKRIAENGAYRLDGSSRRRFVYVKSAGRERKLDDPEKTDSSGGFMCSQNICWCGDVRKVGYKGHPPYNGGAGEVSSAWGLDLPRVESARLIFSVGVPNAGSDGVGVKVLAGAPGENPECVFSRHIGTTGRWVECEADLSRFAGGRIVLKVAVDAGPRGVPHFDGFVLSAPLLVTGARPAPAVSREKARGEALANARGGQYRLEYGGETFLAGVARGNLGLADGAIAFVQGDRSLVIDGFECMVDDFPLEYSGMAAKVKNRIWAEKGTLKISWEMPGVERGGQGSPRFTRIAAGAADRELTRIYFGMGNVIEKPGKFTVSASGFTCSTRHVGADYANALSLVQATDVFPDELVCDPAEKRFSLVTRNDAVISLTPSAAGAFAAAVRFAAVSGYRKSPGYDNLAGRMVLDDWRGYYRSAAEEIALSKRYGLEAVYLQHNWQRWGYDVRLPEVWPPRGDRKAFSAMVDAAHKAGFPIGLHDNYIDIYPDVPGFSYDDVYFHADGTPHEAWYNPGPRILSYKWHPQRIWKWHGANMKTMADEVGAGALFIDVFTASAPRDFYDRDGAFHTRNEQAAGWAAAFDRAREIFGKKDAIMVSEAGHDALIGHVDAGEADHFPVRRILGAKFTAADSERVPWHDAVSHGKMILLGGGLGFRYSGVDVKAPGADNELHGYGSHDYFCTTVIGGRGAMAEWGFSRNAVLTWWILGDVQKRLSKGVFEAFEFGRDIHEQHSVFSSGEVWVNRATNRCWKVAGHELPPYGFYVKAGDCEAGVVRRSGFDVRFAKAPGRAFVDARPPSAKAACPAAHVSVGEFTPAGPRSGDLRVRWDVGDPAAGECRVFVHAMRHGDGEGKIVFQSGCAFADGEKALSLPGARESVFRFRPGASVPAGDYDVRFGLFHRRTGERTALGGWDDGTMRIYAGILTVGQDGSLRWRAPEGTRRTRELGINVSRRKIDFGGIVTDGAFRLEARGGKLVLTPMPGSLAFSAWIDPRTVGVDGDVIDFRCDGRKFEYVLNP